MALGWSYRYTVSKVQGGNQGYAAVYRVYREGLSIQGIQAFKGTQGYTGRGEEGYSRHNVTCRSLI